MSPMRGAAEVAKNFGRALSVNVDVNDSSGSDWDCESSNAEHGEVLVREFSLFYVQYMYWCDAFSIYLLLVWRC
jgi:hypothetical protein